MKCLALNRDGSLLATGGADGTVLLLDIRRIVGSGLASRVEQMPILPQQREILWLELASTDPATSYAASNALLDGGKGSVAFLRDRLLKHEKPIVDPEQRRLLEQLADPDYKERGQGVRRAQEDGPSRRANAPRSVPHRER